MLHYLDCDLVYEVIFQYTYGGDPDGYCPRCGSPNVVEDDMIEEDEEDE